MMRKAYWNSEVVAASDDTIVVDGRHYFPREDVSEGCLRPSQTRSIAPGVGEARYFHVVVGRELNADAAWTFPEPDPGFESLKGRVAFWHGVEIE